MVGILRVGHGGVLQVTVTPSAADPFGFRNGANSVHVSRTMMLTELNLLLDHTPADAPTASYVTAIVDENFLAKPTRTTRRRTASRLRELYGLDPGITLFRLLRQFWTGNHGARPMLAFLVASARDMLLREVTPFVLRIAPDQPVSWPEVAEHLQQRHPGRFGPSTLRSVAQNLSSTWTQAGLLKGKIKKRRSKPCITPAIVAFSLVLGYLQGIRGKPLLDSSWAKLLDCPIGRLIELAEEASKHGWLRLKASGAVMEITFPGLLTPAEERAANEQDRRTPA